MKKFIMDIKTEFNKVVWPTGKELKGSTIITIGLTVVATLFIYFSDRLISIALNFLYSVN